MSRLKLKNQLLGLNNAEKVYRNLYVLNPEVYFYTQKGSIYHNWQEFAIQYERTCAVSVNLPENAPTFMKDELSENAFFLEQESDVSLLMNAKYCPPFWHHLNFIKIMYVVNGSFDLNLSQNRSITLTKGNFVVVPPNVEQSVFSYHDDDIVINVFLRSSTFENAFSSLLMESKELASFFWNVLYGRDDQRIIWFKSSEDKYLENLLLDMYEITFSKRIGKNFHLISSVMHFLSFALYQHRMSLEMIQGVTITKNRFSEIIQYIHEHYDVVSLNTLAEHFRMSEGYLSRYIKKETGYNLSYLIREYRLSRAATMLRETRCSVEEIMYRVGYTDISYFYKVFKKKYQYTPNQFRNQLKIVRPIV